jgi:hypothetical protein
MIRSVTEYPEYDFFVKTLLSRKPKEYLQMTPEAPEERIAPN